LTPRGLALAIALACIAGALLFARPASTPGPVMRDFEAYWAAGSAWDRGADPYSRAIWPAERGVPGVDASRDEVLPFVGPPATLLLWSALARLPYALAASLWWFVLACALFALILLVAAAAKAAGAFGTVAAVALAIAFGPVTSDLALGQVALLALLGATAVASLSSTAGAFLATLQPNVALGALSQLGRNRATLAMLAGGIVAYAAGALTAGAGWPVRYLALLAAHGAAEGLSAIQLSPAAIAYGFGAGVALRLAVSAVCAAGAIAAGIAIVLRLRGRDPFAAFAGCSALVPFVAGFFHEHDLIVAFPAAVYAAVRARGARRTIAAAGTLLVAIDWLGLAQRPTGAVQSALLAAAALAAFAALGERSDLRAVLLPGALVGAILAGAVWLASAHPAPIWPDALGAFHAPPNADVTTVWHDETLASGLLAPNAVWALLRSLSLLGCALLVAAVTGSGDERV